MRLALVAAGLGCRRGAPDCDAEAEILGLKVKLLDTLGHLSVDHVGPLDHAVHFIELRELEIRGRYRILFERFVLVHGALSIEELPLHLRRLVLDQVWRLHAFF